jgi:hypothetical protein
MDSPLPLVIRLAGEITLDPASLTVEDDTNAETLTELASDAGRGVLALSHVLTAIDVKVLAEDVDDAVALTAVVMDAVDELGRFLDALHSGLQDKTCVWEGLASQCWQENFGMAKLWKLRVAGVLAYLWNVWSAVRRWYGTEKRPRVSSATGA